MELYMTQTEEKEEEENLNNRKRQIDIFRCSSQSATLWNLLL